MRISVNSRLTLTPFTLEDADTCTQLLNNPAIYERTLQIPHPYRRQHFVEWFERCRADQDPSHIQLAIRDEDERLLGGIGTHEVAPGHKAEIGYWLGEPYWGRGIMTAVVGAFREHLCRELQLVRITGTVFEGNVASARVLEKNGFEREGLLRNYYRKEGRFLDGWLYAWVA